MLRKLKKINPSIWIESDYGPNLDGIWRPGISTGLTCIWQGFVGSHAQSKMISAFVPGMIPEFTQLDERGFVMTLGWRRILEKVVSRGAARRVDVERMFGVTLDINEKADDGKCPDCRKAGKEVPASGAGNLCNFHTQLVGMVSDATSRKREVAHLRRKHECPQSLSRALDSLTDSPNTQISALSG